LRIAAQGANQRRMRCARFGDDSITSTPGSSLGNDRFWPIRVYRGSD
jgi:hypothetical protein